MREVIVSDTQPIMPFKVAFSIVWSTFWRAFLMMCGVDAVALVVWEAAAYIYSHLYPGQVLSIHGLLQHDGVIPILLLVYLLHFGLYFITGAFAARMVLRETHQGYRVMLVKEETNA